MIARLRIGAVLAPILILLGSCDRGAEPGANRPESAASPVETAPAGAVEDAPPADAESATDAESGVEPPGAFDEATEAFRSMVRSRLYEHQKEVDGFRLASLGNQSRDLIGIIGAYDLALDEVRSKMDEMEAADADARAEIQARIKLLLERLATFFPKGEKALRGG